MFLFGIIFFFSNSLRWTTDNRYYIDNNKKIKTFITLCYLWNEKQNVEACVIFDQLKSVSLESWEILVTFWCNLKLT